MGWSTHTGLALLAFLGRVHGQGYLGLTPSADTCGGDDNFSFLGCYTAPADGYFDFAPTAYDSDADLSTAVPGFDPGSITGATLTRITCARACRAYGYPIAALQNNECTCGSVLPALTTSAGCTVPCGGNADDVCGGALAVNFVVDPTFPDVSDLTDAVLADSYASLGCYSFGDFVAGEVIAVDDVDECFEGCAALGYPLLFADASSGGVACQCGASLPPGTYRVDVEGLADPEVCSLPCDGTGSCDTSDPEARCCGSTGYRALYINPELQGCFTPRIPGFLDSAADTTYECYTIPGSLLGPTLPPAGGPIPTDPFEALIRPEVIAVSGGRTYQIYGCFADPASVFTSGAFEVVATDIGSLGACAALCDAEGYEFFGVNNGFRCVCSDAIVTTAPFAELGLCNEPCELAPSQACGGTSVLDPILLYGTEAAAAGGGIYPLIQELPDLAPLYTCQAGGRPDPQPSGGTDILNGNLNGNVIGDGSQSGDGVIGDYSGNGVGIDLELRHSVEDSIQDSMVSNESFNTDEENNTLTASYSNENNAGAIQDSNITDTHRSGDDRDNDNRGSIQDSNVTDNQSAGNNRENDNAGAIVDSNVTDTSGSGDNRDNFDASDNSHSGNNINYNDNSGATQGNNITDVDSSYSGDNRDNGDDNSGNSGEIVSGTISNSYEEGDDNSGNAGTLVSDSVITDNTGAKLGNYYTFNLNSFNGHKIPAHPPHVGGADGSSPVIDGSDANDSNAGVRPPGFQPLPGLPTGFTPPPVEGGEGANSNIQPPAFQPPGFQPPGFQPPAFGQGGEGASANTGAGEASPPAGPPFGGRPPFPFRPPPPVNGEAPTDDVDAAAGAAVPAGRPPFQFRPPPPANGEAATEDDDAEAGAAAFPGGRPQPPFPAGRPGFARPQGGAAADGADADAAAPEPSLCLPDNYYAFPATTPAGACCTTKTVSYIAGETTLLPCEPTPPPMGLPRRSWFY